MQALLDTSAFLWWVTDAPKLSLKAREALANPQNIIFKYFDRDRETDILLKVMALASVLLF